MSLMNDALRKKNREKTGSPAAPGFSNASRHPWATKKGLAILVALILLTAATLAGIQLMQAAPGSTILMKNPMTKQSQQPVDRTDTLSPVPGPPADTIASPASADGMPTTNTPDSKIATTGHQEAVSASSPIKNNVPTTRSNPPASAMKPTGENTVPRNVTAATKKTPVQHPPGDTGAASLAFEPGPHQPAQRKETMPTVSPSPRSQAKTAPSSPPQEPTETIMERDAGRRVQKTTQPGQDTDPFFQKALAYHRNGRQVEAIRLYQQVLKSDSTHPGAMLNLAAAYIEQGNHISAQRLLNRLEQAVPRPRGVLLNLAITAIGMDDPETALAYLDRAEANADALPWEIRFHRAVAFAQTNRLPEALALYREVETERPDDPRLQFNLAVTCDTLGLYPEALAHYEAVLRSSSGSSGTDGKTIIQRIRTIGRYLDTARSPSKGQ